MDEARPAALVPAQADPERAWRKLVAARDATEAARGPLITMSAVKQYGLAFLAGAASVGGLLYLILSQPVCLQPSTWVSEPAAPVITLLFVAWVAFAFVQVRKRRKIDAAERVIRDFYDAMDEDQKISRLEQFVISADFDNVQRRETPFGPRATTPRFSNGPELDFYWNTLFRPVSRKVSSIEVRSIRMQQVEPDIKLAYVTMDAMRISGFIKFAGAAGFVGIVLATSDIFGTRELWPIFLLVAVAWCAGIFLLRRLVCRLGTYRVRKLLVRSGGQWRLFCGEWEGHEEADLSWLDRRPAHDAPSERMQEPRT